MYELLQMMQSFCEKLLQQKQAAQHLHPITSSKEIKNRLFVLELECESMIDVLKGKSMECVLRLIKSKSSVSRAGAAILSSYPFTTTSLWQLQPFYALRGLARELSHHRARILEDIECKDSYDSNLDESTFLVTPLSYFNKDECFTPSDDVELLLYRNSSTLMISVVSILEGFTDEPPLEENNDLFDMESNKNEWKKILYDAPIDDLIFDPGDDIDEIDTFLDVDIPTDIKDGYHDSEGDIHYLKSLLSDNATLSLPPKVFLDHDPRSLSNDLKIMVKDCPDFEGSRARCFVHRSLALQILSMLILGIRYPKSYRLTFIFSILNKRL
ncbi:hypothetical protein Tco_0173406 [Tanacetum coccineum]